MAEGDRRRWDERYATQGPPPVSEVEPPDFLARHTDLFPTAGRALDLACGQGLGAVWLARRGLEVWGLDVSAVAIGQAREADPARRCRRPLPLRRVRSRRRSAGGTARWTSSSATNSGTAASTGRSSSAWHRVAYWRSPRSAKSTPPRARSAQQPGELPAAFAGLERIAAGEGDGYAWLLARRLRFRLPAWRARPPVAPPTRPRR